MATVALSLIYPQVLPEVPGCPTILAEHHIREAAIEFCERTMIHQHEHSLIAGVADQRTYAFVPPANTVVSRVIEAWYNDQRIWPKTPDELSRMYSNWLTQDGTPAWYTQVNERNIELVPKPSANLADALRLRVTLKPSKTATVIEQHIQEEHGTKIAYGAKARLMAMAGDNVPWSNPTMAAMYDGLFNNEIGLLLTKVTKGFGRARLRTTPQYF